MSFWEWHDDPQHIIAFITLGTSGFYTGRWITKPRPPKPPAPAKGPPRPAAFTAQHRTHCHCNDCMRQRSLATERGKPRHRLENTMILKAELDQTERIIDHITDHIQKVGSSDVAVLRSLQEQLNDARNRYLALTDELGNYTEYR